MSQTKTITLSMETLNKLYFQFIEKYLIPHLAKTPTELTSLLKNKTAYDVHKYLEDLLKISDNYEGHYIKNHYAIGISHNSQNQVKNVYTDQMSSFQRSLDEGISFKSKLGVKRALTGINVEHEHQNKYHNEDQFSLSNLTNPLTQNKYEIQKDQFNYIAISPNNHRLEHKQSWNISENQILDEQEARKKIMKEVVKKMSKLFLDNHTKIEKYSKTTSQSQNKLFNINISTKLQKKEDGKIKQYHFASKPIQLKKY